MFKQCCAEPSLDELFDDFAMQLLMRRDGVTESDVKALLCDLKDIRKAALGGINRKPFSDSSAGHAPDRGETPLGSREADNLPIRSYDCWIIADMSSHSADSLRHGDMKRTPCGVCCQRLQPSARGLL